MVKPVAALVLCGVVLALISKVSSQATPAPATGQIVGEITTNDREPQPVPRAVVTLRSPASGDRLAITGEDGRFVFANLPPGQFTLTVTKPAYVDVTYGASLAGGPATPVVVKPGARAELSIRISYGAVIEGTITDSAGEPVQGLHVDAQHRRPNGDIKVAGQGADTDDRGMYRIFGLPSGEYYVTASLPLLSPVRDERIEAPSIERIDAILDMLRRSKASAISPRQNPTADVPRQQAAPVVFAGVFYPGAASADEAIPLRLKTGEERTGLDFAYDPVPTATVAGTVSGPVPDLTVVEVAIRSGSRAGSFSRQRSVRAAPDGRFAFTGLPPGSYRIAARVTPSQRRGTANRPQMETAPAVLYATATTRTQGGDVQGVPLVLQPAARLAGHIRVDGPKRLTGQLSAIRVSLSPADGLETPIVGNIFNLTRSGHAQTDGAFLIADIVPGRYTLDVTLPPTLTASGWWVRSATSAGRDLLDNSADLGAGGVLDDVILVLSDKQTLITGTLRNMPAEPQTANVIVVFPAEQDLWTLPGRRVRVVHPASDGTYSVQSLPPGEYFVASALASETDGIPSPDVLNALRSRALRLTLADGEHKQQDLDAMR